MKIQSFYLKVIMFIIASGISTAFAIGAPYRAVTIPDKSRRDYFLAPEVRIEKISFERAEVVFLKNGCAASKDSGHEEDPRSSEHTDCWGLILKNVSLTYVRENEEVQSEKIDALLLRNTFGDCHLNWPNKKTGTCHNIEFAEMVRQLEEISKSIDNLYFHFSPDYLIDLHGMNSSKTLSNLKRVMLGAVGSDSRDVDIFSGYAWGWGLFIDKTYSTPLMSRPSSPTTVSSHLRDDTLTGCGLLVREPLLVNLS